MTPFDLIDVAENAFGLVVPAPEATRMVSQDLILLDQPGPAIFRQAFRLRFRDNELEERIAGVRDWFRGRGNGAFTWWIGSHATAGLEDRLLATGAEPDPDEPELAAMALTDAPAEVAGVEVRRVAGYEDALLSRSVLLAAFGMADDDLPPLTREGVEAALAVPHGRSFVAFVDGEPVGRATCFATEAGPVQLAAGCVLEPYRGRGVYRALLRARWDWAAEREQEPVLVTQAGRSSRPILDGVGFRTVGRLVILRDGT